MYIEFISWHGKQITVTSSAKKYPNTDNNELIKYVFGITIDNHFR